jgi:hypothetical protein
MATVHAVRFLAILSFSLAGLLSFLLALTFHLLEVQEVMDGMMRSYLI